MMKNRMDGGEWINRCHPKMKCQRLSREGSLISEQLFSAFVTVQSLSAQIMFVVKRLTWFLKLV